MRNWGLAICSVLCLLSGATVGARAEESPVSAQAVLPLAAASARAWADDAQLVYLENDEAVDAAGTSTRWGLLYWSASLERSRAYSLRENKVQRAEDLDFAFAPPPLAQGWIDSREALKRADAAGGAEFRSEFAGHLRSMVLVRGVLHLDDPERTTWTCVYDAPSQPSLWVVLDAESGKVLRKWKG